MPQLNTKGKYIDFINARDRVAEVLLMKAREQVADELRRFMVLIRNEIVMAYPGLSQDFLDPHTLGEIRRLEGRIDEAAYSVCLKMCQAWINMRRQVFALSHAGEQQAVINATGGKPHKVSFDLLSKEAYDDTTLGPLFDRAYISLVRYRYKVMDAVQMSRILGDDLKGTIKRALDIFPAPERVKRPAIIRRAMKESDGKDDFDGYMLQDFVDHLEYEDIVSTYKKEYVPEWRDPRHDTGEIDVADTGGYQVYSWQLENEMTEDFVTKVRTGSHEGARKQGISDFVWIAVLDSHTDECCEKRFGLTTSEIKDKLSGEWSGDECRAIVPPAHFNCRCSLAPATDDLPDVPESNESDFEEWLNS